MLKVYDGSKNYTCQVIKLPIKQKVEGLDNLVKVTIQGNDCLTSKDADESELYLFFPAECQIAHEFLSFNNLYRHSELNEDKTKKGFFEDNRRVKALKFKGIISTGFIIPLSSLNSVQIFSSWTRELLIDSFNVGDEFNSINGVEICKKYIRPGYSLGQPGSTKDIFTPEHPDTSHLMKNIHKLKLDDYIAVTYKLHGTSARYYNTLTKVKLSLKDKIARFFGVKVVEEDYSYVAASRRVIKSVGFEEVSNKQHYYATDLWSDVGKEYFDGKLNKGEAVYCEIVGKTQSGEAIQANYSYGFNKPKVYIYRISNINAQGIEVDLPYLQMKDRAAQIGVETCPEYFYGKLSDFLKDNYIYSIDEYFIDISKTSIENQLNGIFYTKLLEKSSILDFNVVEEGFCVRKDTYPKAEIFKIKSKLFLLQEGVFADNNIVDIEEEQTEGEIKDVV